MTENAQPQGYFVQDPFTDEVKGPLSVTDLKRWFAKGGVEGWGVSKSPNGPWTLAAQVKGLPPPKVADEASTIESAPTPPEDFSALDDDSAPSIREHVGNVVDLAKQYLPKKVSDFTINPLLQFLVIGVLGIAIYSYFPSSRDTSSSEDTNVAIGNRYRSKFQDLYDRVKGDLAKIENGLERRDMTRVAQELRSQKELLPDDDHPSLQRVGGRLKGAAGDLVTAMEFFVQMGKGELLLRNDSSDSLDRTLKTAIDGHKQTIAIRLKSAKENLEAVEKDPLFDKLMR